VVCAPVIGCFYGLSFRDDGSRGWDDHGTCNGIIGRHGPAFGPGKFSLAMVPAGAVGAHAHYKLGNVMTKLLAGLIPGILIGTYFGGSLALVLSEVALRIIFAAVLIWTGVRYLRAKAPDSSDAHHTLSSNHKR